MSNFFFNFFASILVISVFMTISVNNAVYAVLFLILAFFSTMCILFLLNIDFPFKTYFLIRKMPIISTITRIINSTPYIGRD